MPNQPDEDFFVYLNLENPLYRHMAVGFFNWMRDHVKVLDAPTVMTAINVETRQQHVTATFFLPFSTYVSYYQNFPLVLEKADAAWARNHGEMLAIQFLAEHCHEWSSIDARTKDWYEPLKKRMNVCEGNPTREM